MRFVIACQHEAWRPDGRYERAVYTVNEAGAVQVLINSIQYRLGSVWVALERFRPRLEPGGAAGRQGAHATDRLCQHGARDTLGRKRMACTVLR